MLSLFNHDKLLECDLVCCSTGSYIQGFDFTLKLLQTLCYSPFKNLTALSNGQLVIMLLSFHVG